MNLEQKIKIIKAHPNLPRHIGIIMDGNGRWAKKRGLPRVAGHNEGVNSVEQIVEICGELGIEYLTIYTFSEENWRRPSWEVASLMQLLVTTINRKIKRLMEQNVKILTIGHLNKLPDYAQNAMKKAMEMTKDNTGLILNVALSYGGRQELVDAFRKLARAVKNEELDVNDINEYDVSQQLFTAGQPDPDLIIRTGGENRISNFLLWQIAYAEIYFTTDFWPEFRKPQFIEAVWDYLHRERRFGMVSEQLKKDMMLQNI
ncbi:MAG: isoprenyl transferase [Calditrichaeota bacterium]|nr:isoprenyl transferase [Calditrichota bacterium]